MIDRFLAARLKIERANKHIADVNAAIRSLENTYTSTVEHNLDTGHQELKHMFPDFENVALGLGLIVGDAIHNLHSALDFAWMATIKKHLPSASLNTAKFPVYDTREALEGALNGIEVNPTSNNALFERIVSDIQPYEFGRHSFVNTLHKLDISDKHLFLLELVPYASVDGFVIENEEGEIIHVKGTLIQSSGPYIIPFSKSSNIKDKGKLSVAIAVAEAGKFKGLRVHTMLAFFFNGVISVVRLLENL